MSERIRIAIDLAKSVFQLAVSDRPGKVTRKARLNRAQLLPFLAQQPPAWVVESPLCVPVSWVTD